MCGHNDFSSLAEADAFSDTPIPLLYPQIDRIVPNAGYILTTRGVESWLKSVEWLLMQGRKVWPWRAEYDRYHVELFGSASFQDSLLREVFSTYHLGVSRFFQGREEDILVLDLATGYGYQELCAFLELEMPKKAYPKNNETRCPSRLHRLAVASHERFPKLSSRLLAFEHRLSAVRRRMGRKRF